MRRKWGWILALLGMVLVLASACSQPASMVGPVLKRADTTWYLYRGQGKSNVLLLQFNKADAVVKAVDAVGETAGENKLNSDFANPKYTRRYDEEHDADCRQPSHQSDLSKRLHRDG